MMGHLSTRLLQTRNVVVFLVLISTAVCQSPPGQPTITAPDTIIKDQTVTLRCTVQGGSPAPAVRWLRDDTVVDGTYTTSGNSHVNDYTFVATDSEHLEVFECETDNGVLQSPLTRTIFVQVYRSPTVPTFTGPTNVVSETSYQWVCTSVAGYPVPTMQIRLENTVLSTNQVSINTQFDNVAKTYTVTGIVTWTPTTMNNGQRLYCDVFHPETRGANNPQTVNLPLTVQSILSINAPSISYTATVGQTLSINCVVTSGTAISITWYKNSQAIDISSDSRLSGGTTNNPPLAINQVQTSDTGSYQCQAADGVATVRSRIVSVSIQESTLTETDVITTILGGYNKLVRPTISPTIEHSIHPTRIVTCDGKTLVLQGYTCMYWNDQRLAWTRGQESVSLPSSEIWLPDVTQEGEKSDFYTAPVWSAEKVVVTRDGRVRFCPQGLFTTHNCAEKAGEIHQCTMKFRSWTYDKELMDINLPTGRDSVDISGLESHETCELSNRCAVRSERSYACCGSRLYPDITYTVVWQRKRNYCVNLLQQPTCNN